MAKYKYQSLKNAEQRIYQIFKQQNLKLANPKDSVKMAIKQKKRCFMPFVVDEKGREYFFKARLQKTKEVFEDVIREGDFHNFVKPLVSSKTFYIPKLVKKGEDNDLVWFLREKAVGKFSGTADLTFGFENFFFKKISTQEFARKLINFQRLTPKIASKLKLFQHGYIWYFWDFKFYNTTFLKDKFSKELKIIKKCLSLNRSFLNKQADTLSHGDLYPNNVLYNSKKGLVVFDWGLVHLNNRAFDPAFIWMDAWRNPKWQEEFLKNVLALQKNKEEFKKLFRLVIMSLSLRLLHHSMFGQTKKYKQKLLKKSYKKSDLRLVNQHASQSARFYTKVLKIITSSDYQSIFSK